MSNRYITVPILCSFCGTDGIIGPMNTLIQGPQAAIGPGAGFEEIERLKREIDSLRARLSKLSQATLRITEDLDLGTVLREVIDEARALTGARYGALLVLDHPGGIEDLITSGTTQEEIEAIKADPKILGLLEFLNEVEGPVRLGDISSHPKLVGFPKGHPPMKSFLGISVRHRGESLGNIYLTEKEGGQEFTPEDEETISIFASHAAVTIANARKYRDERQAKASLKALVDTSPVAVVVFDAKTLDTIMFNEETTRITDGRMRGLGYNLEQILKVVTVERPDGSGMSANDLPMVRTLATGKTVRAEEMVIHFPGGRSVTVLASAAPTFSEDGEMMSVVFTMQDMTPLEDLLKQRSEFIGMVGHELRTPLTTIIGAAATALDSSMMVDAAELLQFFRVIDEQAGRMRRLINDLLDVTRIDAGTLSITLQPTDVAALVEEARSTFLRNGARNIVEVNLPPDLPQVNGDWQRMLQVVNNLLSNASKYSPYWSTIRVSASVDDVCVAVSITDEGGGINAERLPHLFEKFSLFENGNMHPNEQGNGLGLAICKGIVEAHGGGISAESGGEGLGARFTFTVPIVVEAVHDEDSPADGPATAGKERMRILAVDDEMQVLRHIRNTLSQAGYTPIVTVDPDEVMYLVEVENPRLILLDLALPGTDGIELMKRILTITDVPVIFVSGYGEDRHIERAFEAGADDYIVKPFSSNELVARVEAVLRRQSAPGRARGSEPYVLGDLLIDYHERLVTVAGQPVHLTSTEYDLLSDLSANAGQVLSQDQLLRRVWGPTYQGDSQPVRTFIKNLRRKLKDDAKNPTYIFTEPRVGYRMAKPGGKTLRRTRQVAP